MPPSLRRLLTFSATLLLLSCQRAAPPPQVRVVPPDHATSAPVAVTPLVLAAPAFAEPQWKRGAGAPLSLTASDGTGLTLTRLEAHAVVNDPLAFTELRLTFDNPRERTIEGTFSITLPPGASVARFAMKGEQGWQEGEVVELQAARRAYEDFLHRRQDPALLEQGAGNEFTARVFPIPAHGTKELIVAYAEELSGAAPFALALKGLPEIAELDVTVAASRGQKQALQQRKVVPAGDLSFGRQSPGQSAVLRSGRHVVARVKPLTDAAPDPVKGLLVLFDTSGSRALGFEEQTHFLGELVRSLTALGGSFPLRVACFDQSLEVVFDGPSSAFGERELLAIKARGALGASNLEQALGWAREHATGTARALVISDGVFTAGANDAEHARLGLAGLKKAGFERLDVAAVGGIRDEAMLTSLAVGALSRDGVVASADLGGAAVAKRLAQATRSGIGVRVEGATFSYPARLDGVQPGDEALVYAEIPEAQPLRIALGSAAPLEFAPGATEAPLLERAFAAARIASLLERAVGNPELRVEAVKLAIAQRVVTPFTALLVLETDADYARFGIARRALANILQVQDNRVASISRAPLQIAVDATPPPPTGGAAPTPTSEGAALTPPPPGAASPDSAEIETLKGSEAEPAKAAAAPAPSAGGLIGIGSAGGGGQGFGAGHGRLGGSHQTRSPRVRMGAVQVNGRLPPDVIQRIVRQNFGRFRLCYEQGLARNPDLEGRVTVRFVIGRDGSVTQAQPAGSDLPDPSVVQCVAHAFPALSFPQPEGGGPVIVTYPIIFASGGGESYPRSDLRQDRPMPPEVEKPAVADPYEGKLGEVMARLAKKDVAGASAAAQAWHAETPGDVLGLVALGETYAAGKQLERAARAYGSIIDLFPARADMRRFAGSRLEALPGKGDALALDSFAKAREQRSDHPSSHRLYAWALLRAGQFEAAFNVAVEAKNKTFPEGRFAGVHQILEEDVGLIGAAWAKAEPARAKDISKKVKDAGGHVEDAPSLRFVLTWETDANDVDFHIYDATGGHAFYGQPNLRSGGNLYADVTTGYGPECFTIRLPPARRSAAYTLQANYYSRGPMGYGMGKLEVIDHDGHGGLKFEQHPYVVMRDQAFIDLGVIRR